MYVIGGFDGRGRIVNQVSVYNPETDTWRRAADLPVAMHHANAAAVDGRIYVLGFLVRGFEEDGRGYIYDPDEDAWTEGPSLPATTHRGASGMAVVGSNIYLLGGFGGGGAVSLMSAYDVESGQWAELPDLPGPPRDHMAVGVVDGQIILAGGRSGRINSHINRVDVFDPATGDWRTAAPMPTSRGGVAAAASGPWFYVVGGEGNGDTATGVFDNVEAYHLPTDSWSVLPAMDTPRHGTGAVVIGDWLYVPGGAVTQAFGADDTHERLRVLP
jgi:N-acetylneuraminic acid mutarotase